MFAKTIVKRTWSFYAKTCFSCSVVSGMKRFQVFAVKCQPKRGKLATSLASSTESFLLISEISLSSNEKKNIYVNHTEQATGEVDMFFEILWTLRLGV